MFMVHMIAVDTYTELVFIINSISPSLSFHIILYAMYLFIETTAQVWPYLRWKKCSSFTMEA